MKIFSDDIFGLGMGYECQRFEWSFLLSKIKVLLRNYNFSLFLLSPGCYVYSLRMGALACPPVFCLTQQEKKNLD